jgi:hypothetical protein
VNNDTPVESIGTWASHADEDVLRTASNKEDAEPGGNDLAAMQMRRDTTKRKSLDLMNPVHAYLYGLIQTDGHLSQDTRNRGKLQIELNFKDAEILEQLASAIPFHTNISTRTRSTNFSSSLTSTILCVYAKEFRDELVSLGMMVGKKSEKICVPACEFSQADYFRGVIDGDGSLGFTANGFPFLSLCIASDGLAASYEAFTRHVTGKEKRLKRNSRDGVFNIVVFKEDAQSLAAALYYEGCIAISRKSRVALEIQAWVRPQEMRRVINKKFWDDAQDRHLLTHTIEESALALQRTERSVKMRLWRLHSSNK